MKRYAVFAKKTATYQAERKDDYTIWHFLGETADREEAALWALSASSQKERYDDVQIVRPVFINIEMSDK